MASVILPQLDDQPRKLDYAKASKSAGVKVRTVRLKPNPSSKATTKQSSAIASRGRIVTANAFREAMTTMASRLSTLKQESESFTGFRLGGDAYHFRTPVLVECIPTDNGYTATMKACDFRGEGATSELAKKSLLQQIHRHFQQLYKTHRMQRDNTQEAVWQQLEKLIDVEGYQHSRVTVLKCFGQVVSFNESEIVFNWLGGDQLRFTGDCLVGGWATLNEGDWCDAVIERRAGDSTILRATLLGRTKPPTEITDEQFFEQWDALPNADLNPID